MNTKLTYLKPLLKRIKSEGGKINRVSPESVVKNLDNPEQIQSLLAGPNFNPGSKNINIPKLKSRTVSKATGIDTGEVAKRILTKKMPVTKSIYDSPGGVVAHEFGHFLQDKGKMVELARRTSAPRNAQSAINRIPDLVKGIKNKDVTKVKRTGALMGRDANRVLKGTTSDILKTEADASSRAMSVLTESGLDKKRLTQAGKSLDSAFGSYKKKVQPLPEGLKRLSDRLPG